MIPLSEAIALGRTIIKPIVGGCETAGGIPGENGCVLDMAVAAVGGRTWHDAISYWSWLGEQNPDANTVSTMGPTFYWSIIHKFDRDVMLRGDMTLDQLIDWVRSIEPQESSVESRLPLTKEMVLATVPA